MAWKESDLISDLTSRFFAIDPAPVILEAEDAKGITWLSINVMEVGKSEKDKTPTSLRKNISYYVFNRGELDEEAWYAQEEPVNGVDKDITASGNTSYSYVTIYNSPQLRIRVLGFIVKAIVAIINEDGSTTDHTLRLNWANNAMQSPIKYQDAFMVVVANNATARSQGNAIIDSDLEWIINSEIKTVATAYAFSTD